MHLPAVILLFHGSRDHQHNEQAKALAEAVGAGYAFMEVEPRFAGEGLAIPMFIADGEDYRKALAAATVKSPPLLKWPGFVDYLRSLGAQLHIFHGPDATGDVKATGIPVAFLYGEPNVDTAPCVDVAAPVVLTRGYIYKKIQERYGRCKAKLLPPLAEQPEFIKYLRETIPTILKYYAPQPP
jgi:hypothetical protein